MRNVTVGVSGSKVQSSPGATLASKLTLSVRAPRAADATRATWVVPPKPVALQNAA